MFSQIGRAWLKRQPLPDDDTMAIERHHRELDRLGEDLELLDREVAKNALGDPAVKRTKKIDEPVIWNWKCAHQVVAQPSPLLQVLERSKLTYDVINK